MTANGYDKLTPANVTQFPSKGEAKRAMEQGGFYLNGERVAENRPV